MADLSQTESRTSATMLAAVDGLQGALLAPATWEPALQRLCSLLQGNAGFLAALERRNGAVLFEHLHGLEQTPLECVDPWNLAIPVGRVISRETRLHTTGPSASARCPGLTVRLDLTAEAVLCYGVFRLPGAPPFTASSERLLRRLVPHLQQVCRTELQLRRRAMESQSARAFLDHLRLGVLLADPSCTVRYANRAAKDILNDNLGGLPVDPGRFRALQQLVAEATSPGGGDRGLQGNALDLPRGKGNRPLHVLVCRSGIVDPTTGNPLALVFIGDPGAVVAAGEETLQQLYSLTSAESRVALAVVRGEGLPGVARRLDVSVTTVRSHLQKVFQKTGAHRQPELTRLLLCGPLQLRLD